MITLTFFLVVQLILGFLTTPPQLATFPCSRVLFETHCCLVLLANTSSQLCPVLYLLCMFVLCYLDTKSFGAQDVSLSMFIINSVKLLPSVKQ